MKRYALSLAAAALAFLGSCASPLRIPGQVDPLDLLGPDLAAYARLSGEEARRLAPAFLGSSLPADQLASLAPLLGRVRVAAVGAGAPGADGNRPLEAVLVGDFPFRRSAWALAADRAWKREGEAFVNASAKLSAAVPASGLALACSGDIEPMLARAAGLADAPAPPRLPARLSALAQRPVVAWLPRPFANLPLGGLAGEGVEVPALGLLISASPEEGGYLATIAFQMKDAQAARQYRPVIRLAWYFLSRSLDAEGAGASMGAAFNLDGELVYAQGVRVPEKALVRALGYLAPAPAASPNASGASPTP